MVKKNRPKRPAKKPEVLKHVKHAAASGEYLDQTQHAEDRAAERNILRTEFEYVLKNGWHEKAKDEYSERHASWKYAIRGKTVDNKELRVVVTFEENDMLVITVIDLDL